MFAARKNQQPPSEKELYMGGKAPEFAVFFNLAFTKLLRTIDYWRENKVLEKDEKELDTKYGPIIDQFLQDGPINNDFSDEIYARLRNYIWKGYQLDRNTAGYALDTQDKRRIRRLLYKLRALRNFHSHVFHFYAELTFDTDLREFIRSLHDYAMYSQNVSDPADVEFYQKNLLKHPLFDNGNRITQEGRTFFLSLFLTTGEMSRLLQQRFGSKKNDELKYRIKHLIYRHYAHRDGAARKYYNHDENLYDTLSQDEQQDLNAARRFYKIGTHVNDVPEFLHSTELFPLFIQDANAWRQCEDVQDLKAFCEQQGLCEGWRWIEQYLKNDEDTPKAGVIHLELSGEEDFQFRFGKNDMQRLLLDVLRLGENAVRERLQYFIEERRTLLSALGQKDPEAHLGNNGDTPITLADYEKYKLRGSEKLRQVYTGWLMAFQGKYQKESELRKELRSKLESAPLEVRFFDLYRQADQKLRTSSRFIEWCVEYLIEKRLTPNWYWAFERFDIESKTDAETGEQKQVLKRMVHFFAQFPEAEGYRLCVDSEHILLKNKPGPDAQVFSLGINALRNLMIALIERRVNTPNGGFWEKFTAFLPTLEAELKLAASSKQPDYKQFAYLDEGSLPHALKRQHGHSPSLAREANWRTLAQARLEHITQQLRQILDDPHQLSRADKNEQIMRCYQVFDWQPKFLRRNEYQQLSIFHYSLQYMTKLEDEAESKPYLKKKIKRKLAFFYDILDAICAENKDRIPQEIHKLLKNATSLDDLLARVLQTALKRLEQWRNTLEKGSEQAAADIARRLKIGSDGEKPEFRTPSHIPFSIHPLLPIKLLGIKDFSTYSHSKIVRQNAEMTSPLRSENYHNPAYMAHLEALPETLRKPVKRRIIGAADKAITQDAILWLFASKYFEQINPLGKTAMRAIDKDKTWVLPTKVGSLRESTLQIPLQLETQGKVMLQLYFHQLDDTLFIENLDTLKKLAAYLYRRKAASPEKYSAIDDKNLLLGDLIQEHARLQNDAMSIAKNLLETEKALLDRLDFQALKQIAGPNDFIDFNKVGEIAGWPSGQMEKIRNLRNHIFHSKIPTAFTYPEIAKDADLNTLLGVIVLDKKKDHLYRK